MVRRRPGSDRATPPDARPDRSPVSSRPAWVRWAVLVMVAALLLSVVGAFVTAVA